jgi:hypothetical protein
MTGTTRVPRSRGAISGILLVLLGLWGGLLPFAGPYVDFGFTPDDPWVYNADRLQLSVAPAAATALGGLIIFLAASRGFAMIGAGLAALGGAWFAVGGPVATLWDVSGVGAPLGTEEGRRLGEQLSGFAGLGVVVVFLAALALGRFAVAGVRETPDLVEDPRYDAGDGGLGPGYRLARDPGSPIGGSGTTQPMGAPSFGRYSREATVGPHDPPPYQGGLPDPADQHVAGEHHDPRG